jgi:ornithine cyclodeaminase
MRIVEEESLRDRIKEPQALESAERAFRALGEGEVEQPPPVGLEIAPSRGEVHVKGAYLTGSPIFAIKVASGFYGNAEKNLPTGSGLVLVFDAQTGFPLALLKDNAYLTDLRTAAAGALAARLLAAGSVSKVAMLGSGVQARYQMRAISRVRDLERVEAWSPHRDHVEAYCREMEAELGMRFLPASSPKSAVRGAQLVVTSTPSREPLVEASWLEDGATFTRSLERSLLDGRPSRGAWRDPYWTEGGPRG